MPERSTRTPPVPPLGHSAPATPPSDGGACDGERSASPHAASETATKSWRAMRAIGPCMAEVAWGGRPISTALSHFATRDGRFRDGRQPLAANEGTTEEEHA